MIKKPCEQCGVDFVRPKKYSKSQWEKKRFCSLSCYGKSKEGVPRREKTKKRLALAHRGTIKPWAGKYKRKQAHRDAIRQGLLAMPDEKKKEVSAKLSQVHRGRKATEAARQRMREACKRRASYKGGEATRAERRAFYQRRREAQKKASGGTHSLREWLYVKGLYGNTCPSCGLSEPEVKLTEDHIIPISQGGSDHIKNIQPLCSSCNSRKKTLAIRFLPHGMSSFDICPPWPKRDQEAA